MKFKKILITSCAVMALGAAGASFAQVHCPESITCDSNTSCRSPDPSWQIIPPLATVQKGDTFQFTYAYYKDGTAQCGYKRSNDNSITLSATSTKFAPPPAGQSSGWPPTAINGGARTCGSPNNPQSATSCPWVSK